MGGGRNTSLLRLKTSGWSSDLREEAGLGIVGPNFCPAAIKNIKIFHLIGGYLRLKSAGFWGNIKIC